MLLMGDTVLQIPIGGRSERLRFQTAVKFHARNTRDTVGPGLAAGQIRMSHPELILSHESLQFSIEPARLPESCSQTVAL